MSRPTTNQQIRFWVPSALSVNELFRNPVGGETGRGRIKTREYEMWRTVAGQEVMAQKVKAIKGQVALDFFHGERSPLADCSNYIKGIEDLMVELGIIEGDSAKTVRRVTSGWVPDLTGTIVHVTPIGIYPGGARWWAGFDQDVLGAEQATVPSGRRQGQKTGEGVSLPTLYRRRGRPPKSSL